MAYYKPLTPDLRKKIIEAINGNILELRTCHNNVLVNTQIGAWEVTKNLIRSLPDGYLIPVEENKR